MADTQKPAEKKETKISNGLIERIVVTFLVLLVIAGMALFLYWAIGKIFTQWIGLRPNFIFWIKLITSLAFGMILAYKFAHSSIRKIPNDPPNKGILVFLGKRQKVVLEEGWCFLPLYPIVFDVICIDVRKVNQDLAKQITKTPDLADLSFNISITWTPGGRKEEEAELFINFLNSGGEERVKTILHDIIRDRLRIWAFSKEEGPSDWQEAVAAKDDAIAILIKAILGEDIPEVSFPVPTNVLLKYFDEPQKTPLFYEKRWGKQSKDGGLWEGLEKELKKLSPEEHNGLKERVEKRREIIGKIRQGNGFFVNESLGIAINRFTITDVMLADEDVAKSVASEVKEKHQRTAETTELRHVRDRAKNLQEKLKITPEAALEIVQTERGKVSKNIHETKINISSETLGTIERITKGISSLLAGK